MRPSLIVILLLIVLLPLALLIGLGVTAAGNQRKIFQQEYDALLLNSLAETEAQIARFIDGRERDLLRITDLDSYAVGDIRGQIRTEPLITQIFVIDGLGRVLHPPVGKGLNDKEREFLRRTGQVWKDNSLLSVIGDSTRNDRQEGGPGVVDHGWHTWYWGSGLNFIFWQRHENGYIVGAEVDHSRLLADIVAMLPESNSYRARTSVGRLAQGRIRLLNTENNPLYEWGEYNPAADEPARVSLSLRSPLSAWTLTYHVSAEELDSASRSGVLLPMTSSLIVVIIALIGLGVYFYRESVRDLREAGQRVSFVNQVSHELKTPLTNIRMYAEMLEARMPDADPKDSEYLNVIVNESQRLSRMINNVLTFAKQQKGNLALKYSDGNVDDCIRHVMNRFAPTLETGKLVVQFDADADRAVRFDSDALEQILGNLFSNVEKYARDGGALHVRSAQTNGTTIIEVEDKGPGISEALHEEVFNPFFRGSDKLTDGVAGTGIGLGIARDLARLHGGDLRLKSRDTGTCFEVTLKTDPAEDV